MSSTNGTAFPPTHLYAESQHIITTLLNFVGLSSIASLFSSQYLLDSLKLFVLGSIVEGGRRLMYWIFDRFRLRYRISAQFSSGDPVHDWILLSLIEKDVWRKSRDFQVTARTSLRKWGVSTARQDDNQQGAEFVPAYGAPHLFRWKGYWMEVMKDSDSHRSWRAETPDGRMPSTLSLTIYTLDMSVLTDFIEAARLRYIEVSKPRVTVHTNEDKGWVDEPYWNRAMTKFRRPMDSLILQDGVIEGLLDDAREFLESREWYFEAGIPHRRGYLIHGPPGTGKTSTIHTMAGELGLEIYQLSLASQTMDDAKLSRAILNVPARSILLIEDIDCAFGVDGDDDEDGTGQRGPTSPTYTPGLPKRAITLSGLLNAIDGVGSDEGRLFFATTNHPEWLDPALVRPGRIDVKIEYKLASKKQAFALFNRFFPASKFECLSTDESTEDCRDTDQKKATLQISELAARFAEAVPENVFSTAELQGFLLSHKKRPINAVDAVREWVEVEWKGKREREEKERKRKEKIRQERAKMGNILQLLPGQVVSCVSSDQSKEGTEAANAERVGSDFGGSEDFTLVGTTPQGSPTLPRANAVEQQVELQGDTLPVSVVASTPDINIVSEALVTMTAGIPQEGADQVADTLPKTLSVDLSSEELLLRRGLELDCRVSVANQQNTETS